MTIKRYFKKQLKKYKKLDRHLTFEEFDELSLLYYLSHYDENHKGDTKVHFSYNTHIEVPTTFEEMIPKDLLFERVVAVNKIKAEKYNRYLKGDKDEE